MGHLYHGELSNNQVVYPINIPLNHYKIPLNHYKIPLNHYKIPLNHYKIYIYIRIYIYYDFPLAIQPSQR